MIAYLWQTGFAERPDPKTILTKIGVSDHLTLVGGVDGVPKGFSIVFRSPKERGYRLDWIATDIGACPKGFGSFLLAETEKRCRDEGSTSLRLAVRIENWRAIRMYKAAGYEITEERITGLSLAKRLA